MSRSGSRVSAVVVANVKASPKQSIVLLVATVVLVVMLVRQFGGGPDKASAKVASLEAVATGSEATSYCRQ